MVSLDLPERGDLDPQQRCHRAAHGKNGKFDSGMCRIGRRDAVIDQLRRAHGQCFCGPDIASRAIGRPIPRRLRFECKEDCQQAEAYREGCTPQEWGIGEPSCHTCSLSCAAPPAPRSGDSDPVSPPPRRYSRSKPQPYRESNRSPDRAHRDESSVRFSRR